MSMGNHDEKSIKFFCFITAIYAASHVACAFSLLPLLIHPGGWEVW